MDDVESGWSLSGSDSDRFRTVIDSGVQGIHLNRTLYNKYLEFLGQLGVDVHSTHDGEQAWVRTIDRASYKKLHTLKIYYETEEGGVRPLVFPPGAQVFPPRIGRELGVENDRLALRICHDNGLTQGVDIVLGTALCKYLPSLIVSTFLY